MATACIHDVTKSEQILQILSPFYYLNCKLHCDFIWRTHSLRQRSNDPLVQELVHIPHYGRNLSSSMAISKVCQYIWCIWTWKTRFSPSTKLVTGPFLITNLTYHLHNCQQAERKIVFEQTFCLTDHLRMTTRIW